MRVVGGSFGNKGLAFFGKGARSLIIEANQSAKYVARDVIRVDTRTESDKKFGCVGFIVGVIILGGIGMLLAGPIGFIVAFVICVFGSYYSVDKNLVDVHMLDGSKVTVQCRSGQVTKLVNMQSSS
ncbi:MULTISPECIES: hypothetical protein [unclassified Marinimicrobium]|jgi:hypothetical protein|uniref:hypothetical protein n=1 Tax=unclassified Marinimicrobium TaxID=2632100 RepID=UPI000C3DCBB3|nr:MULTISPECIES: hypothetical protein [unclassified Marinimicrobium]MAN51196.1 hypothetical protein [Marinimicrobium sp.]|tara:strand:- start:756 stop:1133 length:378 start_codon:yes stop_codon:yes gene_type:complete